MSQAGRGHGKEGGDPGDAAVDVAVVDQRIGRAVRGDADTDRHEAPEAVDVESDEQADVDDRREHHGEPVVGLPSG